MGNVRLSALTIQTQTKAPNHVFVKLSHFFFLQYFIVRFHISVLNVI